jgi:superfamily II DNA or RNA helicase
MIEFNDQYANNKGWPLGESWVLGDSAAIGVLLDEHTHCYTMCSAPRIDNEMNYVHEERSRKISKVRLGNFDETSVLLPKFLKDQGDDQRNHLIIQDVVASVRTNRFPVVLIERREHLDLLTNLLAQHIQNVIVMSGGMGKKQRKQLVEQIAAIPVDQPRVLVATGRYLGEGFDNERLDTLFLALPISWRGTLTQYAGRLHRLNAVEKVFNGPSAGIQLT